MARVIKGKIEDIIIQPDRSINEKNDGTLEGQVVYKCVKGQEFSLPKIGEAHPDDTKLECYNISKTHNSNGLITATASYFGLTGPETDPVISYSGGNNQEPIETHPEFVTELAGSVTTPKNGAIFEDDAENVEYGTFIKFGGGAQDTNVPKFRGVEYYLTPSTQITLSYWTDKVPSLKDRLKIYPKIEGVSGRELQTPPDVKNFLLLDTPYRQVGSFYQVTEQYLGSGPDGWNEKIYVKADAK
jgi:hypothetical protein